MKNYLKIFLVIIFTFILITPQVTALEEKFIGFADDNINYKDDVNGSVALAGNNIKNNKNINGILFGAGNNININGEVEYLVLAGNNIEINSNILNDVIIAGNTIEIDSNTVINRDLIIAGNEINISGTINRDVTIIGSEVEIENSNILGDVTITAENISIGDNTSISKTLTYNKDAKIEIENKELIGSIEQTKSINIEKRTIITVLTEHLLSFLRSLVVLFALVLIVPKLFKKIAKQQKEISTKNILLTLGKGLLAFIAIPIIILILLISNLGIPLGLISSLIYGIIIYISTILSGYYIGLLVWNKLINKKQNSFLVGVIGILIIYLLKLIPYISIITSIGVILLGFGIIVKLFDYKKNQQ